MVQAASHEYLVDRCDFALDTWFHIIDMAVLDCSDGLDPTERCFYRTERSEALSVSQDLFQCGMVALDPIVLPLLINVRNAVKCGS